MNEDDHADQPMLSRSGRSAIAFNGEIYNYRQIARELNIRLASDSDTELVLESLEKYGVEVVSRFDGMFSFVIFDKESGQVTAARDRFGIKPLFVYQDKDVTLLSSSIQAINQRVGPLRVSSDAEEQIRTLRNMIPGTTIFRGVTEIHPGTVWKNGQTTRFHTFQIPGDPPPKMDDLEQSIFEGVTLAAQAGTSVGAFLSSGVDSSLVAAITRPPNAWIAGGPVDNEFSGAQLIADRLGIQLHMVALDLAEFLPRAASMIKATQHPLLVPNEVLIEPIAEQARSQCKVLLSGEGADELFGGYDRITRWSLETKKFDIKEFSKLYCYTSSPNLEIVEAALQESLEFRDPALVVKHFFLTVHLQGLLHRLDRMTMHHSIEARPVYLSNRIVDQAVGVHPRHDLDGPNAKVRLRAVAQRLLPNTTANRPKIGFPYDLAAVFNCSPSIAYDRWLSWSLERFHESLE